MADLPSLDRRLTRQSTFTPAGTIGMVPSPPLELSTHCIGIAVVRRKDTPPVRQIDRHHSFWRLHEVLQRECCRRAVAERDRRKLHPLLLRHAERHAPAQQHSGDDPMLARDLRDRSRW